MSNKLDNLDSFTRSYIATALWSETDNADDTGGAPLDKNYSPEDLADETVDKMIADCAKFQADNPVMLQLAYNTNRCTCGVSGAHYHAGAHKYDEENAGHDFWLTRNRHGAGFWDGDLPEDIGKALTDAAHMFKECNLIVGDDGKIHVL